MFLIFTVFWDFLLLCRFLVGKYHRKITINKSEQLLSANHFKLLVVLHITKLNAHINVYKKYYFKSSQNHFPKRDHTWKWNIKKWSVRISIFCPWQIICPILLTCLLPVLRDLNIVNFFLIPVMLKSCQQKSFVK